MYCRKCGYWNPETAQYCVHCGEKLKKEAVIKKKALYLAVIVLCAMILGLIIGIFTLNYHGHKMDTVPSTQVPTEQTVGQTENLGERAYQSAVAICEEMRTRRAYSDAVVYLRRMMASNANDGRYEVLLGQYKQLLCDDLLVQASDLVKEGRYRQAIQTLCDAKEKYQLDSLQETVAEYRKEFGTYNMSTIAAGKYNTIILRQDGSVDVTGDRSQDEYDAGKWSNIVAISAGDRHIMGLTSAGSVVSCGRNDCGQCNVSNWKNAVAISAGDVHSVALLEDGTVVAKGYNGYKQCNVEALMRAAGRKRIVSVSAGYVQTLALLEDGTVVACGENQYGACDVGSWTDISAIYTGSHFSVGLKNDGTVKITGKGISDWGVSGWTDIINMAAGDYFLIGLRSDGTVVSAGFSNSEIAQWQDIRFIAAGHDHVAAVDAKGNIYCAGNNGYGQCGFHGKSLY